MNEEHWAAASPRVAILITSVTLKTEIFCAIFISICICLTVRQYLLSQPNSNQMATPTNRQVSGHLMAPCGGNIDRRVMANSS